MVSEARRTYLAIWREKNRDEINAQQRAWYARNPEKNTYASRKARNPEKVLEGSRRRSSKYYQEHKEEISKDRERANAASRRWNKRNLITKLNNTHKYRALKRGATIGMVDLAKLIQEWDRNCGICKESVYGSYDVDHIIPLSKGGAHTQDNLQLTHSTCNRRKGNR